MVASHPDLPQPTAPVGLEVRPGCHSRYPRYRLGEPSSLASVPPEGKERMCVRRLGARRCSEKAGCLRSRSFWARPRSGRGGAVGVHLDLFIVHFAEF